MMVDKVLQGANHMPGSPLAHDCGQILEKQHDGLHKMAILFELR